jgi:hypothetical protein
MAVSVNEATGEATVELDGITFRLHGTMTRIGDLERALGVDGLIGVNEKLARKSADVTLTALRALCTSGNEAELDGLLFGRIIGPASAAIFAAIFAALPEDIGKPRGNAVAATKGNGLRGRDTARLPTAS